jgi:DegT/DnrJ/EryC1/StrS aminotransferase family
MIPFVDLPAQFRALKPEIEAAVGRVLENAQYILGPAVAAFEKDFAAFCQTSEAIGVNSGTSALHLALLAAGVKPGDEVINLGNNATVTLLEMIRGIEEAMGMRATIDWQPEQPGDVPQTWARVTKARDLLGYEPRDALHGWDSALRGLVSTCIGA